MLSRTPEQLEQWVDSHQAVELDPATMTSLLEKTVGIDAQAFGNELHGLVDEYQSRVIGNSDNVHMSKKIKDKFHELGFETWTEDLEDTAKVQSLLQKNASSGNYGGNVFGRLKGTDLADEQIVVGAHYDSVNWQKKGVAAPGVDDNGSGSALVQVLAKALATLAEKGVRPRRSIMFVGFNAEEEGCFGSEQMARRASRGDYGDIKAVLIADEVAYPGRGSGSRKAIFETDGTVPGTQSLVDTFAHHAQFDDGDGIQGFEVNNHGFGSDHIAFLKQQIPSVLLIERNNMEHADKWGHSEKDTFEHVDMEYGAAMARLMLRVVLALADTAVPPTSMAVASDPLPGLTSANLSDAQANGVNVEAKLGDCKGTCTMTCLANEAEAPQGLAACVFANSENGNMACYEDFQA
jgi:hypothetical protein